MRAIVRQKNADELILEIPLNERWLESDHINVLIQPEIDWDYAKANPNEVLPSHMVTLRHTGYDERGRDVLPILEEI